MIYLTNGKGSVIVTALSYWKLVEWANNNPNVDWTGYELREGDTMRIIRLSRRSLSQGVIIQSAKERRKKGPNFSTTIWNGQTFPQPFGMWIKLLNSN
jgi:hypothetical protein